MNYFKGEKIQVVVSRNTTRISEKYEIKLNISEDYGFIEEAKVVINEQRASNERELKMEFVSNNEGVNTFSCQVPFYSVGLYYFTIKLKINNNIMWIKNDIENKCAVYTNDNKPYWTVTVYEDDFKIPSWAKGKIMYQIFPDRFYKSENYLPIPIENRVTKKWGENPDWNLDVIGKINNNDFFMGNLQGITEKLDYIKDLGVEIIYLNPVFSAQSNHRYDTSDYEKVDPYLGTNEDLKTLCKKAHEKGIKIILDGVLNHTGNNSKYFNQFKNYDTIGAFEGAQSPYYNWYKKDELGNFQYWWGFKNLPVCDGDSQSWQNYVYGENGIIDKWFSIGIDGLRLDVSDELTDEFIENVRKAVKRNKDDGFIIGEVWDNAITKEGYGGQRKYLLGKGLDSVMNYPFTNAILKYVRFGNSEVLTGTVEEILTQYPEEAVLALMNSLSTHDITRVMTTLVGKGIQSQNDCWVWDVPYTREWQFTQDKLSEEQYEKAKKMLKIATVIQYFLPGNPCIYYGDEAGLYGYKDPFNRKCFPWNDIDKEIHDFYVELGNVRKQMNFLAESKIRFIDVNEDFCMFERIYEDKMTSCTKKVFIAINRTEKNIKLCIPSEYKNCKTCYQKNIEKFDCENNTESAEKYEFLEYGILIKILE